MKLEDLMKKYNKLHEKLKNLIGEKQVKMFMNDISHRHTFNNLCELYERLINDYKKELNKRNK